MGEEAIGAIDTDQDENKNQVPIESMNMQPVVVLNDIKNSPTDIKVIKHMIVHM